jgi:hypothetical protein
MVFVKKSFFLFSAACYMAGISAIQAQVPSPGTIRKLGVDIDMRSMSRVLADEARGGGNVILSDQDQHQPGREEQGDVQFRGGNVQVNDPKLDNIQIFPGFRPFVRFTQSETSIASYKKDIVATYNTSAGIHLIPNPNGPGLIADREFLSGFSHSGDGGKTWKSGFFPPLPGSIFTFGDPSVDVDRKGNFYFAGLGADKLGNSTIQVNKSTDGGASWSPAVLVQQDDGSDKEWLAVGPDPKNAGRDNVYVTWTSFQADGSAQLRLGRSFDGGATWTVKIIFAPPADPNPTHPQNSLQGSNPVVDAATGFLYVPFVNFSNSDQDFIRVLISKDAGETFSLATFNIPGTPSPTLLPITQSGDLIECGVIRFVQPPPLPPVFAPNLRLTIHSGSNIGGSLTGLPRYISATRLITQPAFAASNGVLYMAWSNSTSPFFGDPQGHSNIMLVRSDNGGKTWTHPNQVNPHVAADIHHVEPALTLTKQSDSGDQEGDSNNGGVNILYYTQHSDGSVDVDLATSSDRGNSFQADGSVRVTSTSFGLAPTNIPLPTATNPFATTNYDRQIAQCYDLGEYLSIRSANSTLFALWGDGRNTVKQPVNPLDPISGQTHPQEDVFFQTLKTQ